MLNNAMWPGLTPLGSLPAAAPLSPSWFPSSLNSLPALGTPSEPGTSNPPPPAALGVAPTAQPFAPSDFQNMLSLAKQGVGLAKGGANAYNQWTNNGLFSNDFSGGTALGQTALGQDMLGLGPAAPLAEMGGFGVNSLSAGLGGLGSLLNFAGGVQSGNPGALIGGALGAYNAASGLTSGALPALSAELLGAAAVPIAALTGWFSQNEEANARNSGWWNNPIKGQLYSNATAGVERANQIGSAITDAGGFPALSTDQLMQTLSPYMNAIRPYYETAQGGSGALRASDTVTGGSGGMKNQPYTAGGTTSPEQYVANFTRAQTGVTGLVQELLNRGVSYETLGELPMQSWEDPSLDLSNPLWDLMRSQGPPLAPGADPNDPWGFGTTTYVTGNPTDMYGGPLWSAMARMGVGGPPMQDLIRQNFNIYANGGGAIPSPTPPAGSAGLWDYVNAGLDISQQSGGG